MYAISLTDLAYFFTKGRPSFRQNVAKVLADFDNLTKTLPNVEKIVRNSVKITVQIHILWSIKILKILL